MSDTCDVRVTLSAIRIDSRPDSVSINTDPKKPTKVMAAEVTRGGVTLRFLMDDACVMHINLRDYRTGGPALAQEIFAALNRAMNPANNRVEDAEL